MKYKSLLLLAIVSSLLVSCKKTSELYARSAYNSSNFDENYYLEYNNVDKVAISKEDTIDLTASATGNPEIKIHTEQPGNNEGTKYLWNEDQVDANGKLLDWTESNPKSGVGTQYGPTKCLTQISDKFSYGILSKLYDGRIHCGGAYGLYTESRVQLNKTGFGTFFPMELKSAKYFGMSIRGAINNKELYGGIATLDIHLSFYRHVVGQSEYEKYNVNITDLSLKTSTSPLGYFFGFYFDDYLKDGPKGSLPVDGIIGYSMTWELKNYDMSDVNGGAGKIAEYGEPTDDMNDKERPHFAIYLYETLIPDSIWL